MPNVFLTDAVIARAKCPHGRDQIIYWDHPRTIDGNVRNGSIDGLGVRISKSGKKAFIHSFYLYERRKRVVIGKALMGVASARLKVMDRNNQLEEGIDPDRILQEPKLEIELTFRDITEQYQEMRLHKLSDKHQWEFARLIAPWLRKPANSNNKRGRNKKKDFKAFGQKFEHYPPDQIKPLDVVAFLERITSDSRANAALSQLKALFNWANKMQIIDMRNPCSPIDKRKIYRRRPEYTSDDIASLSALIFNPALETLETQPENTPRERQRAALARGLIAQQNAQMLELCNFLGVLFLTMARPNELKLAKFEHFDLERLIWHKHNTKGIKLSRSALEYEYRSVPIHPRVAEIIQRQRERWPLTEYVFPSHTDPTKPRNNFKTVLSRFKQFEGVPVHFQMYDIKRIAISLMLVGQGVERETVSHYVDHKGNLETTMIYDLGFVDPMRPVADKLGELLGV